MTAALHPRIARLSDGEISYLERGDGPPLVFLHGIGSGAQSWRHQLERLSGRFRVVAWNAPGYAGSTRLAAECPSASDYVARLVGFLAALRVDRLHLVGHSLGALMAARFAADHPARILSLTLSSMASGHASLPDDERERLMAGRLGDLAVLGPRGMAEKRGPRLLGPDATPEMIRAVVDTMAAIDPAGYTQAVRMLSRADLRADIARLPQSVKMQVVVADHDIITPPGANRRAAAARANTPVHVIPRAGHAAYLEKPADFEGLLLRLIES